MTRYIAFLRAINVAGHARVTMNDLRGAFATAGCRNVTTYIQSGNVIFESPARNLETILRKVRGEIRKFLSKEPEIALRTLAEAEDLVRAAPFAHVATGKDTGLYVVFLSQAPRVEPQFPLVSSKEALEAIGMKGRDVFVVSRRKPNGSSGFPNKFIEDELGVPATTRNWSTVTKMAELARR